MTFANQSFTVKVSAAVTVIMFVAGLINSILSFLTFQSKDLRKVGCGMYLLASSITSFLTISMFTVKFWFVVLTQMNVSISPSLLRGGCVSIEPILKLFVYLDTWLNACVAVERAVNVSKGVTFDKEKSKRIARWIIIIFPLVIMATLTHEPIYRELFEHREEKNKTKDYTTGEYTTEKYTTGKYTKEEYTTREYNREKDMIEKYITEYYAWCVTRYPRSVQDYNTAILFFHLVLPFIANLYSAVAIIFRAARQRSVTRTKQTYREHVLEQLSEHKQLLISPIILLVLASPRLVISLLSGCVDVSSNLWLYLSGYFISFTPSMLVFIVFVLPSELYRKTFKESLSSWRQRRVPQ